ncbi:MAG: response regulator [Proteobacteria bacterium]|nr:response regulator [Pseudomonadota bacterium]
MSPPKSLPDEDAAEQRRAPRERVLHRAVFVGEGDQGSPSCMILDISTRGARMQMLGGGTAPDRGTLLDVRTGALHEATTVWRSGCFAGVAFTSTVRLDQPEPVNASAAPPPLRVLAVDDDEINRCVLERVLNRLTADVSFAVDGRSSVEAFEQGRFDVVLMDLRMPGMDGYEAIRRTRGVERERGLPRTPIIVVSAHDEPEEVARAAAAGADDHVVKPVVADLLLQRIRQRTRQAAAAGTGS